MNHSAIIDGPQPSLGRGPATVAFVFGVAACPELPRAVLTRLLVDLGLTTSAAHALLARMLGDGLLGSIRRGRDAGYRLTGSFEESSRRVRDHSSREPASWTGAFDAVLYQVPERHRSFRDSLRRSALLSGYGLLQDGVLIALSDRHMGIPGTLQVPPPGARVLITQLAMNTADAARCAFDAWDLGTLERTYESHIENLERALRELQDPPVPSSSIFRGFAELARAPLTDTLRDPGLPPELLPVGWPGARLRQLLVKVNTTLGPAAATYAHEIIDRHPRPG